MGPVPHNFQSIYKYLSNKNEIIIEATEFPQGYTGEQFKVTKERSFNSALFSKSEIEVLDKIALLFSKTSTLHLIEQSHLEEAWKKNQKNKAVISYEYAFDLVAVK